MTTSIRDILTDAIRYWERLRILYNAVLAAIFMIVFVSDWPFSKSVLSLDLLQTVFVLAVLANIAYCAAYVVDLAAQYSAFREQWKRYRVILFIIGVTFAGIITRFVAMGFFSGET